jgi:NaMN:DMB phosphoribosyltransferase
LENVALGTTRWIIKDPTADLVGIVKQIGHVPVLAANLDFSGTKHEGLTFYEKGLVKEGVGAGGISIAAFCQSSGAITCKTLFAEIEKNYEKIMALAKH